VGAQRPTHLVTPEGEFDFSDGDDAIDLAAQLGLDLFDWQRWLVRWILATDADGRPACGVVIIEVPRQNGKGAILECIELYWLIVAGVKIVIHTAHEADTAGGHQERLDSLIGEPEITLPNLKSYKSNGKEKIRNLDEKLLLQFRTRTKGTKRGASPQRVILDESQELQAAHLAALVPAMAAQSMNAEKMPQLIYAGSAPLEHSQYMHELTARVLKDRPPRTLMARWALTPDDDVTDRENWARVNPSLGLLISEDYIEQTEYLVLSAEDFAAERLGVAKGGAGGPEGPISVARWAQLIDGESMAVEGTVALALDAPIDRRSACFAIYGRRADNLRHVAIRYWLSPNELGRLVEVAKALVDGHKVALHVPPRSPALAWREDLMAAGVPVVEVKAGAFAEAQKALEQAVVDGSLRHRGQPEMSAAVSGLAARVAGDQSPWSRRSSGSNVAPLFAAAAAMAADGAPQVHSGDAVGSLADYLDDDD
jgi:phage terminase large subunit-like protein